MSRTLRNAVPPGGRSRRRLPILARDAVKEDFSCLVRPLDASHGTPDPGGSQRAGRPEGGPDGPTGRAVTVGKRARAGPGRGAKRPACGKGRPYRQALAVSAAV